MVRQGIATLVLLFAALSAAAPLRASSAAEPKRIIAVGDLHGDYSAWLDIARAAGLIDGRGRWAGGATTLVQAGDVPDRGPDSLKIIRHLMALQREARKSGGRILVLVGNHEAMNVTGDLRYVDPGEYAAFVNAGSAARRERLFEANRAAIEAAYRAQDPEMSPDAIRKAWMEATPLGLAEHRAAWHPEGEIGRWVRANPALTKIGDTLFVHGGISPAYAALSIEEINRRAASALTVAETDEGSIINDPLGPLWYRGLAEPATPEAVRSELDALLTNYGASRIVIAHTPILTGIAILHDGRLIRIDTGISAAYGGQPSYLEIVGSRVIPHSVARSRASGGR